MSEENLTYDDLPSTGSGKYVNRYETNEELDKELEELEDAQEEEHDDNQDNEENITYDYYQSIGSGKYVNRHKTNEHFEKELEELEEKEYEDNNMTTATTPRASDHKKRVAETFDKRLEQLNREKRKYTLEFNDQLEKAKQTWNFSLLYLPLTDQTCLDLLTCYTDKENCTVSLQHLGMVQVCTYQPPCASGEQYKEYGRDTCMPIRGLEFGSAKYMEFAEKQKKIYEESERLRKFRIKSSRSPAHNEELKGGLENLDQLSEQFTRMFRREFRDRRLLPEVSGEPDPFEREFERRFLALKTVGERKTFLKKGLEDVAAEKIRKQAGTSIMTLTRDLTKQVGKQVYKDSTKDTEALESLIESIREQQRSNAVANSLATSALESKIDSGNATVKEKLDYLAQSNISTDAKVEGLRLAFEISQNISQQVMNDITQAIAMLTEQIEKIKTSTENIEASTELMDGRTKKILDLSETISARQELQLYIDSWYKTKWGTVKMLCSLPFKAVNIIVWKPAKYAFWRFFGQYFYLLWGLFMLLLITVCFITGMAMINKYYPDIIALLYNACIDIWGLAIKSGSLVAQQLRPMFGETVLMLFENARYGATAAMTQLWEWLIALISAIFKEVMGKATGAVTGILSMSKYLPWSW